MHREFEVLIDACRAQRCIGFVLVQFEMHAVSARLLLKLRVPH